MKKHLFIQSTLLALLITVLISACNDSDSVYRNINVQEAAILIDSKNNHTDFVILDVRTPEEFDQGHLQNAILLDYYTQSFLDELNQLEKHKIYLVYCHSGKRSRKTLNLMKNLGFTEVYNMSGGILQWNKAELPTIR